MATFRYYRTITDEEMSDLMSTALKAITYWADDAKLADKDINFKGWLSDAIALDKAIKIHVMDEPDDVWHILTLNKVLNGLGQRTSFNPLNYDEVDGDAIIQYALFGELIYG